jgi:hypothetical protein
MAVLACCTNRTLQHLQPALSGEALGRQPDYLHRFSLSFHVQSHDWLWFFWWSYDSGCGCCVLLCCLRGLQMWDLYQRQLIDTKVDIWVSPLRHMAVDCRSNLLLLVHASCCLTNHIVERVPIMGCMNSTAACWASSCSSSSFHHLPAVAAAGAGAGCAAVCAVLWPAAICW